MVSSSNYKIRIAVREDVPELLHIFNKQYNNKFNSNYFLWQYFNTYNKNKLICIDKKGTMVGMFGVLVKELNNGMTGLQAADMLVLEELRGKGFFHKMAEFAFSLFTDYDFLFVLPNANGKAAIERNLKWKTIARINDWQLNCNNKNVASDLSNLAINKNLLSFMYPPDILEWRFSKNPLYSYKKHTFNNGTFIYSKFFKDQVNNKTFLDICFYSDDSVNLTDLKQFIDLNRNDQPNELIITSWAFETTMLSRNLLSLGFAEVQKERYFCIKVIAEKNNFLYDPLNWNLYQSDTEFY